MKQICTCLALLLLACLSACSDSIPKEKAEYIGEWQQKDMVLQITAGGTVNYRRRNGNATTSMTNVPIQEFEGNNFVVGIWRFSTTFVVSKPPFLQDGKWRMVVDGVELVKADGVLPIGGMKILEL